MSGAQALFESRAVVRAVRAESNIENVLSILKKSPREELTALCPVTNASLLFHAVQRPNDAEAEQICRFLCDELSVCDPRHADKNQQTALFFAARDGSAKCVLSLIARGCDPNHPDSALQTALFYATRDGRTEAVRALLDAGANANAIDHLGQTALFYGCRDGRKSTVALMLERGANPNVKDRSKRTALFYAQRSSQREVVALLKAAGAHNGGDRAPRSTSASKE